MSYLIQNDQLVARVEENLKSGEEVRYSNTKTTDVINSNREFSLVNAEYAKVSNAKKWDKVYRESNCNLATLLNDDGLYKEYLV